jgi:predicted PolB exonuclease-like 3'-5' exonuclease
MHGGPIAVFSQEKHKNQAGEFFMKLSHSFMHICFIVGHSVGHGNQFGEKN